MPTLAPVVSTSCWSCVKKSAAIAVRQSDRRKRGSAPADGDFQGDLVDLLWRNQEEDVAAVCAGLRAVAEGRSVPRTGDAPSGVIAVLSGQGAQWIGMARGL